MTSDNDLSSLSGSYALGALEGKELEDFEALMANSQQLRNEVTELSDTAVLLGLAVQPVEPPAALRASILSQISSVPQLAPIEAPSAIVTPFDGAASRKAQSRWFTKPAIVLAGVAAAVGLIAGGGVLVNTIGDANTQQVQADALAAITSADDSQQAAAAVDGGGTAKLVWSNSLGSSAVMVDGLAALEAGKVYELWYIDDEGARAAGTFTVGDSGATWRVLDGEMRAGDLVGVTVEPAGGSEQPTTDPIVAIQSA